MIIKEFDKIIEILKNAKNIAIVGISKNEERASYQIAKKLDKHNLFLVNPKYANEEILGRKVYSSLKEINEEIDIVDVFRNRDYAEEVLREAIEIKAKFIWFQPGSENIEAIEKYKDRIDIIFNACIGVINNFIQ
ncbi:MAG: CoA-binding protein [Thermoplasmatales archaeon]|nr:CoA-binding protein [Thermoplasmatales archaeon]